MLEPIVLQGQRVDLEPLAEKHHDSLCTAVNDGELWTSYVTPIPHPNDMQSYIRTALSQHSEGKGLCFVIVEKSTQLIVGCTRFSNVEKDHGRANIGYTFISQSHQGTGINIEAKYLMLKHAFDTIALQRIEIITDYFNYQSQRAILALGAKHEGLLRNHMTLPDGRVRDSLVYSIIASEWPGVERHLQARLRRHCALKRPNNDKTVVMLPQATLDTGPQCQEPHTSLTEI